MNGGPLPNWVKLLLVGALLAWQAAAVFYGQREAVSTLTGKMEEIAVRDSLRGVATDEKLDRRTNQLNAELHEISLVTKYVARKVE